MKNLIDGGFQSTKELFDQGLQGSKELAAKAGAKAQELGEKGITALEIRQLEGQAQKLLAKLGELTYKALVNDGVPSVSAEDGAIRPLIEQLNAIRDEIERKENGPHA
jgi:predicted Fe-Mo cluster-binding NifX family protein